jgi:hypothetical protein
MFNNFQVANSIENTNSHLVIFIFQMLSSETLGWRDQRHSILEQAGRSEKDPQTFICHFYVHRNFYVIRCFYVKLSIHIMCDPSSTRTIFQVLHT